ncbi:hypothetical protein [Nocardia terpenica]|uniref:Uncharacterized protein n=1 Tax=Nocardia terpenica TaxID=455432 RepID=A0A6G9Z2T8_9NOCA|nr:hypothetical protein [Nocardia terpenica]QIS19750.1 hypothetical protein F6W96_17080 [Nocardia terpenica]
MAGRFGRHRARIAAVMVGTGLAGAAVVGAAGLANAAPPASAPMVTHGPNFQPGPGDTVTIVGPEYPDHVPAQPRDRVVISPAQPQDGVVIAPARPALPATGSFGSS